MELPSFIRSRRAVLCLPVNVIVCVVLSIVVCPGVVLYKGAWAPVVKVAGWDWAAAIFLTEAVGIGAGMTAVPPGVAVPTVAVLGAGSSEMPNLVAGVATRPGLEVSWAVGVNMANMATHGAEVVHVDDWGGGRARWGVLQFRGGQGEGELEAHGRGGRAGSVGGEGACLTLIKRVVSFLADGAGGRGGLALSFVLLLVLSSVRWDRNRA